MPALDWIFVSVLLFSMLLGAWRGLVYEVLSLVSWVVAFVMAQWFAPEAAQRLPISGVSEVVRYAAGFVLVFIAALMLGGLIAVTVKKLMASVGLRSLLMGHAILSFDASAIIARTAPRHASSIWASRLRCAGHGASVETVVRRGGGPWARSGAC